MMIAFWKNYTDSYRRLFRLGLPVLVTQLGVIIVSFADTMMVGTYGTDELAAAAFVNSLFVVVTVMQMGFASGLTPLVGALFGKGDRREAGRTLRGGLQVNLIVSTVFTMVMACLYFFLDRFGQDPELLPLIRQYYLIVLFSLIPMAIFNSFQQTCNGVTDTATPMWFMLGANVLNILGNWVLIFGRFGMPELGLAGAGLSTLAARVMAAAGISLVFMRGRRYREYTEGFRSVGSLPEIRRKVWVTSYPVMIQSGVECLLWAFGAIVCGWYGKIQLAAYQVVNTISQLGFMTYMSFGIATSVLVANHIGIGDFRGVRKITSAGLHLILLLATGASLVFYIWGRGLIRVFTPDETVIASALGLVLPLIVYQYMDAIQLTYCNAIRGTSRVQPLLWISLTTYIVIGVPVLLWFASVFPSGNEGVYWSFCVALLVACVMLVTTFYRIISSFSQDRR